MKLIVLSLVALALVATTALASHTVADAKIKGQCRKCLVRCVKERKQALTQLMPDSSELEDLNSLLTLLKDKREVKTSTESLDQFKPILDYTPCFKSYWHDNCFSKCPTLVDLWHMLARFKRRGLHLAVGYRRMHAFDYKQLGLAVPAEVAAHDAKLQALRADAEKQQKSTEATSNDGKKKHKQHKQKKLAVAEAAKTD